MATSAKQSWGLLRSLGRVKPKTPSAINFFSGAKLNDHFSAIVNWHSALSPQDLNEWVNLPVLQLLDQQFRLRAVTMLDVHTSLRKASFTSCGHDNITLPMIKQGILTLGPYILALINKSLNTGTYPSSWKLAHMNLLSKTSHPTSPNDAHPVALLDGLSKLTEKIVQQN